MANDPVVILGTIDTENLKQSINTLVSHVEQSMQKIASNVDSTIGDMKRKLSELKDIDVGNKANSGSNQRSQNLRNEVQEVNNAIQTYDKLGQAVQKAAEPKSARESFFAFHRAFKEQAQGIATQIREAEAALNRSIENRVSELNARIEKSKEKIHSLQLEITKAQMKQQETGNFTTFQPAIARAQQEMEIQLKRIADLKRQIAETPTMMRSSEEAQQIARLREEHERVSNIMKEEVTTKQQSSTATAQQVTVEKQKTEEIQRQAQELKKQTELQYGSNFTLTAEQLQTLASATSLSTQELQRFLQTNTLTSQELQTLQGWLNSTGRATSEEAAMLSKLSNASKENAEATARAIEAQRSQGVNALQLASGMSQAAAANQRYSESERMIIGAIERTLNLQRQQVNYVGNVAVASYDKLNAALRQAAAAYNQMGAAERNSVAGQRLLTYMHELQRELQLIQAQARRPINLKEALGNPENTLENITYKLQQLRSYLQGLDLSKQKNEIKQVSDEISRLEKKQGSVMSATRQWTEQNNALTRSLNYMKNRLAFVLTIGGTTQLVKQVYEIRSEYEMLERSIGILIDSASQGSRIFHELNAMAIQSPFTAIELGSAAKQLTAYDVAAKDVVNTTKRLADMAAAVGVPIDRLTYALGQIKAYGYLNARDARMFANAGIPLVKQLADHYTALEGRMVSVADIYDRIKKKAISYNDVMQVVNKMTDEGGKFFNYQERVAGTMKVQLANLSLAWNNMLNAIGKSNQELLTAPIKILKVLMQSWRGISNVIRDVALAFGVLKAAQIAYVMATQRVSLALATVAVSGQRVTNIVQALVSGFGKLIATPMTWWLLLASMVVGAGMALWDAHKAMEAFNQSVRDAAKENVDNITRFLRDYQSVRDKLYEYSDNDGVKIATPTDANLASADAEKAWEAMREQIEQCSGASTIFLERLDNIDNVNERLRQGFDYVDKILAVSNAMKELNGDTLDIGFDYGKIYTLWLGPEGLITNVKDYAGELRKLGEINAKYINDDFKKINLQAELNKARQEEIRLTKELDSARKAGATDDEINKIKDSLDSANKKWEDLSHDIIWTNEHLGESSKGFETLQGDINKLYESAENLAKVKGWFNDPDQLNEMFGQIEKIVINKGLEEGWSPDDAFAFQMEWEEKRSEAARQATQIRLEQEKAAYNASEDEKTKESHRQNIIRLQQELNDWDKHNGRMRVMWQKYCQWMRNEHLSEVNEMFKGMTAEEIRNINWSEDRWDSFARRTAAQFAREHNISFDNAFNLLRNWVKTASTWEIVIGLTITTEDGKGVYDSLVAADQKVEDSYNRAKRLKKRLNQLEKEGKKNTEEYRKAQAELRAEEERGEKARAEGGESRSEESDNQKQQRKAESNRKKQAAANKKARNQREKANKQRQSASKKQAREAQKAAHEAESELQKTLREEMQIIDKVQKAYNDLTKAGLPHDEALSQAIDGFDNTVSSINAVLKKWGLETLDLKKYAGIKNPKELYTYLEKQLDDLIVQGKAKPEERLELETKIRELKLEVEKYNVKDVIQGINNALTDVKEQYDFAIQLDAQPELSNIFTKLLGISDKELKAFPHDAEQLIKILEDKISDKLLDLNNGVHFTLSNNLSKEDFDTWVSAFNLDKDSDLVKSLESVRKWVNDIRLKEVKDQISAWDKLLSKYSEYEYKRKQIMEKAEKDREVARKKNASKEIFDAINNREKQDLAELDFNEFQKSPEWITATGDLANMTRKALLLLIDSVKDYKNEAKNLTPKQITKINNALRKLHRQLRKGNPWHAIADALDEAKARAEAFDPAIKEVEERIKDLQAIQEKDRTPEQQAALDKLLERLKKLKNLRAEAGKINVEDLVEGIQGIVELVSKAAEQFDKLAVAIGGKNMTTASAVIGGIAQNLQAAASGAALGAQIGGGWGAAIGAIGFGLTDLFVQLADIISGNKKITEQVEASELEVKNLDNAYKRLQYTVEKSLGTAETSARRAVIANKELQLVELKRQLQLEQSRKKKNQDKEKMADLQGQIIDLEQEIENLKDDIVTNLLGEDVKAAAESFVDTWVSAWKEGEDTLKAIGDSFDTMINTMIKKAIASAIIAKKLQPIYDAIDFFTSKDSLGGEEITLRELDQIIEMTDEAAVGINEYMKTLYAGLEKLGVVEKTKDKSLSNLQQGISSVTEETANAVEAYLNSMSQQAYLRNDYLLQIVTMMQGMDMNITTGVQAQMLFTMQQSYQLQQSMYSLMEGWTVPAGNGLRVELIN